MNTLKINQVLPIINHYIAVLTKQTHSLKTSKDLYFNSHKLRYGYILTYNYMTRLSSFWLNSGGIKAFSHPWSLVCCFKVLDKSINVCLK